MVSRSYSHWQNSTCRAAFFWWFRFAFQYIALPETPSSRPKVKGSTPVTVGFDRCFFSDWALIPRLQEAAAPLVIKTNPSFVTGLENHPASDEHGTTNLLKNKCS